MARRGYKALWRKVVYKIYIPYIQDIAWQKIKIVGLTGIKSREHEEKFSGIGFKPAYPGR
jgi:hypothetical protein